MTRMHRLRASAIAIVDRFLAFDRRRNAVWLAASVVLSCALLSLWRGQDTNWDLRNYHLYNAYAWLTGRLAVDLAPAQLQSYFVPWLDVPYFLAAQHWPRATGLWLGAFHGLAFVSVAGIAWQVLAREPYRHRLVPLLALAGCTSAVFLAEMGNTMGDNATAVFVLAALWCVLSVASSDEPGAKRAWLAGTLLGLGVAFKLTNAMYALALGVAVLCGPWSWRRRVLQATHLTAATVLTVALVAGPWWWRVWHQFGNPVFPHFNPWFRAPLALPVSMADTRWLPSGVGEALVRPLRFTENPLLISEVPMIQLVWAALYLSVMAWGVSAWVRRRRVARTAVDGGPMRVLLVFFFVAFVVWSMMFSIHRYLVVLELLAPLVLWQVLTATASGERGRHVAGWAVAACVAVSLGGAWLVGKEGWGHSAWRHPAFQVDAPDMPRPSTATVLLVGDEPQAWRVPFLPAAAMYASVASNFPESPRYRQELERRMQQRAGAVYAMVPAAVDSGLPRRQAKLDRLNTVASLVGLDRGECTRLRRLARNRNADVATVDSAGGPRCRMVLRDNPGGRDFAAESRQSVQAADAQLVRYGRMIVPGSCRVHDASIGAERLPYQWCEVARRTP